MTKVLKIVSLGLIIWSLGLLWPEVNLISVLVGVIAIALVLGLIALLINWQQHINHNSAHPPKQQHSTRPVAVH